MGEQQRVRALEIETGLLWDEVRALRQRMSSMWEEMLGTILRFHPLTTPLTHDSFDGDSFSDVAVSTIIENTGWSSAIPAAAQALLIEITARDSAAWGTANLYFAVGPTSENYSCLIARPAGGDVWSSAFGPVPCTNGDLYYQCNASGTDTLDVYLTCWGYWT